MIKEYAGKVAVVTGAANGIGKELAKGLAQRGCKLVVNDIHGDEIEAFADELKQGGAEVVAVQADVSLTEECQKIFDATMDAYGRVDILRTPHFLDALTVYRDRRDYPHKLCNAIEAYGLGESAVNSHRAVDDARATVQLLEAMSRERDDLDRYLNLFGTHPKYGLSGRKIASVTYRPQPYQRTVPLYELP